jgi:nucleoid DNA-binding protein
MDMNQKELACAVAERSGLSREESADLSRAVLEAIAGQLSDGAARRLDEVITQEAGTPAG